MRRYTQEEKMFLKDYASGHSHQEIMEEFNRRFSSPVKISQVKSFLHNNKLSTGRTGRFEKGHVPANKGMHTGGWEPTQFRKGHMPANHKPVGTEVIHRNSKRDEQYIYVKVAEPKSWRMKHILVWEKHNGPVPKGNIIIFLDGNTLNTDISNLTMIDRKVHVRMNQMGLRYLDKDSTVSGIHVAELMLKIAEAGRR